MNWNRDFDHYLGNRATWSIAPQTHEQGKSLVKYIDTDIGRSLGFQRVALHFVVIPPGFRSSFPHAESHEEEFVYVLKGRPHLWLDGFIHDLYEGHAVGFPAGTGEAHCFINNTEEEVHLLVAGEKTKKENLCSFPINPERRETCQIWWNDPPKRNLGPHNGVPGPIAIEAKANFSASCIVNCADEKGEKTFHYPGDNETFDVGFRISNKVGLKALGIWFVRLPPGRRSSYPHAHTHEEEFVYMIRGQVKAWMNGYVKEISSGDWVGFPAGTGICHTIINDTDAESIFLCVGESQEFPDEKIAYPLHPLRRKECERKGWYWRDHVKENWGLHSGKPISKFPSHLRLRLCSESDAAEVLDLFLKSPRYFDRVDGCHPSLKTAETAIQDGPREKSQKYFKEFLVIEHGEEPIGVLDLHANHPQDGICYLGLLLIKEACFGQGLGTRCYRLAEDYIKRSLQCQRIRIGISEENDVTGFWTKVGFLPNGKSYRWKGENKTATVNEFEKTLPVE